VKISCWFEVVIFAVGDFCVYFVQTSTMF